MATIARSMSAKTDAMGRSEIMLRVSVKRGKVVRLRSGVYLERERFDDGRIIMPRKGREEMKRVKAVEDSLKDIESALLDYCLSSPDAYINKVSLERVVASAANPGQPAQPDDPDEEPSDFHALFRKFADNRDISEHYRREYRVVGRLLRRFELYSRIAYDKKYSLSIATFSHEDMARLEKFYLDEWRLCDRYPQIYDRYPATVRQSVADKRPARRGGNAWADIYKKARTFFNWCRKMGLTANDPTERYEGKKKAVYGTPWYLTMEERDRIAELDLSAHPRLAVQRDVFVFQCLVGCRVGDLKTFTHDNISDGCLQYVPSKTSKAKGDAIKVPLSPKAAQLAAKYPDCPKLFPFISDQKYNEAIKRVCALAGIDRMVTVLNPTTGKSEQRPLCEIASSHMARRTFIGNLYKKVKDPNLIGSMTGHAEGSAAFARYRDIDDDVKRQTIALLEQ